MPKLTKLIKRKYYNNLAAKEKILNSSFIKNKLKGIDIAKTNLNKNFSYLQVCLDDFKNQKKCSKNKCFSKFNGYWNDFSIIDHKIIKTIKACNCLKNKKGNWISIENISLDTFSNEFQNTTINNFITHNKTEEKIKAYLIKAIKIFPKHSKPLFIFGKNDLSKKNIMAGVANQLYAKNPNIAYINLEKNLHEIKPLEKEKFIINKFRYKNTKALFIDNVGSEKNNGFVRDFFLYEVLKYRIDKMLFTMVSSQFSLTWLKRLYSKNNSEIKAEMLINLIMNNYLPIELKK